MKQLKVLLLCGMISIANTSMGRAADLRDAVVKVITNANRVDYYRPWQSKGSRGSIGSGSIIAGNRILTNAHVVSDQTFVQVKKYSDPKRYTAKVVAIGHDCDLALLEVEDPKFFEGTTTIEIGDLPRMQDTVNVVGFPTGGDEISVTEGVISRIEVNMYAHSFHHLLTVQIDAAINPGNSGGPVVKDDKLIGVAMQSQHYAENIGYLIPTPVVQHFLADLKDGNYDGFPELGVEINTTENKALREYYKIADRKGGVLVSRVQPFSPAEGFLKEGDVIFKIDGTDIGEDGTVSFREAERVLMVNEISEKQVGDSVSMTIARNGEDMKVEFPLKPYERHIATPYSATKPPYYIYGGLVFTVLSADLIKEWGDEWWKAPLNFNYHYFGPGRFNEKQQKEVVVLLQVLPDDINDGYHEYSNLIVSKVNGQEYASFKDFVEKLYNNPDPYTFIETDQRAFIILKNEGIVQANQKILERNNIPVEYSTEVAEWINESEIQTVAKPVEEDIVVP